MSNDITFMPAVELVARIKDGTISATEAVTAFLERIEERNPVLNAYITLCAEDALAAAKDADARLQRGEEVGALHGLPIAVKDLFDFKKGVRHTFGCKAFADNVADVDISYIEDLERAGAIVLGKTNLPEFGFKGVTDNLLFGPTSTPFAVGKNAGGSSGGSAAAVADGMAAVAQGTDGGGSIRIPASFCGVYGFKASYGRVASVSRPDAFISHTPFVHSGPLSRTVKDAALMLSVMAGPDDRDPLCLPDQGIDYLAAAERDINGLKIGYTPDFGMFPVDDRVRVVVEAAVQKFADCGAHVEEIDVAISDDQRDLAALWVRQVAMVYAAITDQFADDGIDLLGEHRDDLPPEFREVIEIGQRMTIRDYKRDELARTRVFDAVQDCFEKVDIIASPTLAVPPFEHGTDGLTVGPSEVNGVEVDPLIGWCMTYQINFTGHPAASVPAGLTDDGLPIGMQLVGRRWDDATVLAASGAFEHVAPWQQWYGK